MPPLQRRSRQAPPLRPQGARGYAALMPRLVGINHVAVEVGDVDEALAFLRHIGLVVDDREETLRRARDAGAQMIGGHDFLDPWGNHWQVVDYRDIQFTKAPRILAGMGVAGLHTAQRA